MSGSLRLSVVVCLLFAAGCADQGPVASEASAPLFAVSTCQLGVSDAEARSEIGALQGEIGELSGSMKAGQAGALKSHLANAQRSIDSGNYCPALAQLRAFRSQVKSFVNTGVLTEAEAEPLLAGVGVILDGRRAAPSPPPPLPVSSVSVAPTSPNIEVSQAVQLTATTRDASNNALTGRTVAWSSSNDAVARVGTNGLVTGMSAGTATITATSEGRSGSAMVTVAPRPVASVTVAPATPSVIAGQTVQLTATTLDAGNNVLTGRTIAWSSSDEAVATVSVNGLVTGVGVGTATITATSEGQSGSALVTVAPPAVASVSVAPATPSVVAGQTVQLTATTLDAGNNELTGRTIAWSSSNDVVATVDANGLVTGVSAGTATITATSEGQPGSAVVTVTAPPRPLLNPSFELDGVLASFYGATPTGWSVSGLSSVDTDNFGGDVGPATTTPVFNFPHFVGQGTYGARLFTRPGLNSTGQTISRTFNAGERVSLSQEFDFTGVLSLQFDAQLRSLAATWRTAFVASVLIDGVTVWSRNVSAIYRDNFIDTSAMTGVHTLEFRLEAVTTNIVSGAPSMWFMFDNVRLVR